MTDTPNHETTPEEWWDRGLTSAGRRDILKAARLRLPSAVRWRHLGPEARAAVEALRPAEAPQKDQPPPLSPKEALTQLRIENSLLRAALWLSSRALKDYSDAIHRKADQEGMVQLTVPESLKARTGAALAKANQMLKDQDQGIRL